MNATIESGGKRTSVPVVRLATPYLVWVLLYLGAGMAAMHTFPHTWYCRQGPGGSPPWYFIGQDAVDAAWSSAAALLMLAFSFASLRRLGPGVWACLAVAQSGFVRPVCTGVNILLHTRHLSDESLAVSEWTTFDAYLRSLETCSTASLWIGVVLAVACLVQYVRALRASGGVH